MSDSDNNPYIKVMFYYRIYNLLVDKKMLKNNSPKDILMHFSRVHKLKIRDKWVTSEMPKKIKKVIEIVGVPIT